MHPSLGVLSARLLLLQLLALASACGSIVPSEETRENEEPPSGVSNASTNDGGDEADREGNDSHSDSVDVKKTDPKPPPIDEPVCTLPEGVGNAPESIGDVVAMINGLPKPLSIACFVQLLPRPLYVNATSSQLSVQPATSEATPRIFIFRGPLIITFVPAGEGAKAIELSYLTSSTTSVKAEIDFPVTETLAADAGFASILTSGGGGTTCAGCHSLESSAPASFGANAFVSKALKPLATRDVSLFDLGIQSEICATSASERCANLRAVFDHGEVLPQNFPLDMPTLF